MISASYSSAILKLLLLYIFKTALVNQTILLKECQVYVYFSEGNGSYISRDCPRGSMMLKRLQNDSPEGSLKNESHTPVIHYFGNTLQNGITLCFLYFFLHNIFIINLCKE